MAPAKQRGAYAEDWAVLAERVKAEAGWTCVRCGHAHDPASGHTLTVHHFDGDKSNNERWNLMPLCQRCHLSVQARVDPKNPLMFQPNDWALPYIAGFYMSNPDEPRPASDMTKWIWTYEQNVGDWPEWAPAPECSRCGRDMREVSGGTGNLTHDGREYRCGCLPADHTHPADVHDKGGEE